MVQEVEILPREDTGPIFLHINYHRYWCPVDARGQNIGNHVIDIVFPQYFQFHQHRGFYWIVNIGTRHRITRKVSSFWYIRQDLCRWFSARLLYLQCVSNGDTAVCTKPSISTMIHWQSENKRHILLHKTNRIIGSFAFFFRVIL